MTNEEFMEQDFEDQKQAALNAVRATVHATTPLEVVAFKCIDNEMVWHIREGLVSGTSHFIGTSPYEYQKFDTTPAGLETMIQWASGDWD